MANLSDALHGMLSAEVLTSLTDLVSAYTESVTTETVTSGALNPAAGVTYLSVTGTVAYTLANGTRVGQRKTIVCTVAASTPAGTLTPAHLSGGTTLSFNAVNDSAELFWDGTNWRCLNLNSVTLA